MDLSREIERGGKIEIITSKSGEEALDIIRHDAAHIMAQAVKELYPETQISNLALTRPKKSKKLPTVLSPCSLRY